jgi:DNA-binding SARP family transcriptional activator
MHFGILGALEMTHDNRVCTPTAPKVRWTLALLLVRANRIVGMDAIIEELWGNESPRSAVTTAQTYIYQLRKCFDRESAGGPEASLLETRPPGYLLRLAPDQIDATIFERLVAEGRMLLEDGQPEAAAPLLRQALGLWRGPVLANITPGRLLEGHVAHLEELRLRAIELRIQAESQLGRYRELIPELRSLVAAHPLNEWLHGRLIDALHRAGRRGEALLAYRNLRQTLNEELGLEPSGELQRLQRQVLGAGPVPAARDPRDRVRMPVGALSA